MMKKTKLIRGGIMALFVLAAMGIKPFGMSGRKQSVTTI